MTGREPLIVTGADDVDEEELQERLDDLTDLEVYLDIGVDDITVQQGPGACSFDYPFDLQDLIDWTYFFENDYTVRYEILDDVQRLLERNPMQGRNDHMIEDFVRELLLSNWIATDGSDLMIMDVDGQPLELSARYAWTTRFTGDVQRPYRPDPSQPTRAQLHPDGRLVVTPTAQSAQPLELDLSVVDVDEAYRVF